MYANGVKTYQLKAKDSGIKPHPLCYDNISKDFAVDKMKKIAWNGYVYEISPDYDNIYVNGIVYIHKYLMEKHDIK